MLFLSTLAVNSGLVWWFWLGYNLFTPHSNIIYTGWAWWSWKLLLAQAWLGSFVLVIHLILSGQALLQRDILRARKITLLVILILSLQLTLSFLR